MATRLAEGLEQMVSLALLLLAQQTTCQWIGTVWTCNQQRSPGIDWSLARPPAPNNNVFDAFRRGQEDAARQRAYEQQQQQQLDAMRRSEAGQQLRRAVGSLIASGKCEQAVDTALRGGDLDLASQAQNLCK